MESREALELRIPGFVVVSSGLGGSASGGGACRPPDPLGSPRNVGTWFDAPVVQLMQSAWPCAASIQTPRKTSFSCHFAWAVAPACSIVQGGPRRVARRCARGRLCLILILFLPVRAPGRASNEEHRTGRTQRPDAQYRPPLFHLTALEGPVCLLCVPANRRFGAARHRISIYRRVQSFDKANCEKNHARENTDRNHAGPNSPLRPKTQAA